MKVSNKLFMTFLLLLGVILTSLSGDVSSKLSAKKCVSSKLKSANQVVMVTGITLIVSSISFFVCLSKCGCSSRNDNPAILGYLVFSILLSILLTVLGSIIKSESKGECSSADKSAAGILYTGVTMLVILSGYFGFTAYKLYKSKGVGNFGYASSSF